MEREKEFVSLNPSLHPVSLGKKARERVKIDDWVQSEGHAQFSIATRPEKPFIPHESFQNCHTCLGL